MSNTQQITEEAVLTASDMAASDRFGYSVSMSSDGSRCAVGACYANKAYIFTRSGTVWTQEVILIASDKVSEDLFGISVSMAGDGSKCVVGACDPDLFGTTNAGKAYIFSRSGTTWTQEAILSASDMAAGDYFGYSVAMSSDGTRCVVGAYGAGPSGVSDAGKAYIFTRSGTTWTQEAILTASDMTTYDQFGVSVSMSSDGTRCVVGTYDTDLSGLINAGKAYIFTRSGTVWTQEAMLTASDKATGDLFGASVSIAGDGTRCVVGALHASPSGLSDAGKAYIFTRSGTTWTQEAVLTASDKASCDNFGISVSMSSDGSRCMVGAYGASPSGLFGAGKAYIFTRSGTVWTQEAILTASNKAVEGYFGISVSMVSDGSRCVVGAHTVSPSGLYRAGEAYVFS